MAEIGDDDGEECYILWGAIASLSPPKSGRRNSNWIAAAAVAVSIPIKIRIFEIQSRLCLLR